MDAAERAFIESLLQTHRNHLQVLEQQAATFGVMAPPYVVTQITEYQQKIAELEARLRPPSSRDTERPRHNLPPRDYERFVGRQQELAELRRLLGPKSRSFVVTIDGIGGIGKSALALEMAYVFVDQYNELAEAERFEAIVWVSAKRTYLTASGIRERRQVFRTLEDVFAAIARVLDYPAITRARVEEQRTIVELVLREQRTLLILDNLETVDDEDLMDFLHELPEPTKALVTTRHRIDVARPIRLTDMAREEALILIVQEAARKDVSLSLDQQEELWKKTGGMPLAIVWSIGLMGLGASVGSVLHRLGSGQSDIAYFCFDESISRIRGCSAYYLLLALSVFAADASREAIGVVAGLGEDEAGRDMGLEELLKLSLVNKEGERFSLLPLTRSFVTSEATTCAEWMADAQGRLQSYFYEFVKSYGGWSDDQSGHDRVERDLANIFAVINSYVAHLRYDETDEGDLVIDPSSLPQAKMLINFIARVSQTSRIRGYWSDCEKLYHTEISIGRSINDIEHLGWACYTLGKVNYYRDDLEAAERWILEAREVWKKDETENAKNLCRVNRLIGLIALRLRDLGRSERFLTDAMKNYQKLGGRGALQNFLNSMGQLAEQQADLTAATSWYQQSIDAATSCSDLSYIAYGYIGLGRVTLAKGDITGAQTYYSASLKYARECGRVNIMAQAYLEIALLEYRQNQQPPTELHTRQALDLFRRLGMKREQAEAEALLAKLAEGSQNS